MFLRFPAQAQNEVRAAFRAIGAVSPATAKPRSDLTRSDEAAFDALLRYGIVREGAPGTFYLYEPPRRPGYLVRLVIFWLIVVILPVAIIQSCPNTP
ncbi:MAG TPA: hypothetical protein VM166_10440 [Gemmatimonadaceae bacterium]|nr:hypothetical protein [Gemmatimonadaceae bacterium]